MTRSPSPTSSVSAEAERELGRGMNDTLPSKSIEAITGYKRPSDQIQELNAQGFYWARRSPVDGSVILERPYFEHSGQSTRSP
jgi:Domain of unknown function (DUF4224)